MFTLLSYDPISKSHGSKFGSDFEMSPYLGLQSTVLLKGLNAKLKPDHLNEI